MKIIVAGDTHGDRNHLRWLLDKAVKHDAAGVFVLGDFGIWDHHDAGAFTSGVAVDAKRLGLTVWFLPGNHENYDILERIEKENPRNADGFVLYHGADGLQSLRYAPRGLRWSWSGVSFLALGGAFSVDKDPRVAQDRALVARAEARRARGHTLSAKEKYALQHEHYGWWPQEEVTDAEADAAAAGSRVDIMLAHDKPISATVPWNRKNFAEAEHNQRRLQRVVDALHPSLYLHGHFHYAYMNLPFGSGTSVHGLDCDPESSAATGGSGDRRLSWGLLDLGPASFQFHWQEADGAEKHRTFTPGKEADD